MFKKTIKADYNPRYQKLITFAGYTFLLQFILFVCQIIFIAKNASVLSYGAKGEWTEFLLQINQHPDLFLGKQILFLALRTCYTISFLGLGIAFLRKNKSISIVMVTSVLVAVPMINLGTLYQITLIQLSHSYADAVANHAIQSITAYEITAKTLYSSTEYADLFVNIVPFLFAFICLFILMLKEPFFQYSKWIVVLIALLPFNRFVKMPAGINLASGLLNIAGTIIVFIVLGVYLLKLSMNPYDEK